MEARHARKTTTPQATGHRSSAWGSTWGARERGPSSARTGLLSRASSSESPRFAGQPPLQHQRATSSCEITPFSMQFLRRSQCRFYAIFIACFTPGILGATLAQPPDHRIARILGRTFHSRPLPENASHSKCSFWDAASACSPVGIACPTLRLGRSFRLRLLPETVHHFARQH